MPATRRRRAAAGLLAPAVALTAITTAAPPVAAEPMDPIPGNGFFLVGPDIRPGLYRTSGTASAFGVWINDVPTQESMCLWFT